MAGQQWVRLNLASSVFPFMTEFDGRSIIQAGLDQNYNYLDQIGEPIKDRGIPQSIYMHNVMPTAQGYQAVGYDLLAKTNQLSPAQPGTNFDQIFELISESSGGIIGLLAPCTTGVVPANASTDYIYEGTQWVASFTSSNPRPSSTYGNLVSTAFVAGETYVFYSGNGTNNSCYLFTPSAGTRLTAVTLLGVTINNIAGICGSNGYNIVWGSQSNNIAWSNQTNALDFVPSIATGAGGGSVAEVKGSIIFCAPFPGGFILYCTENVVSATYTGNSQFPFAFKEVSGSSGIGKYTNTAALTNFFGSVSQVSLVAYEDSQSLHYMLTGNGLQQVNLNTSSGVFPDVSDFLAKKLFEDFDEINNVLVETPITNALNIKMRNVSNRYLVISYCTPVAAQGDLIIYTHALVFDSVLARWGKLKINHTCAVETSYTNVVGTPNAGSVNLPYKSFGFLDVSGQIFIVNMDLNSPATTIPVDGVLIFGKIQSSRNKFISHQRTDIENVNQGDTFSAYIIPTFDGKTLQPAQVMSNPPNLIINAPKMKRMALKVTCQNFLYLFKGAFNLVSLLLDYTQEGHR